MKTTFYAKIEFLMKNTNFSQRLNIALDKEGFPPKHKGRIQLLAEMMGLTHRGASKWINGETCPPSKKFPDLAQKLNIKEEWLKSGTGAMSVEENAELQYFSSLPSTSVPLYAIHALEDVEKSPLRQVTCDLSVSHGFAIQLDSEAMSPRFPAGSIIIFDPEKEAKDGDFILIKISDYPIPIFRQVLKFNNTIYLNAHNPKFDRLVLYELSKVLGVMIQAILSFI